MTSICLSELEIHFLSIPIFTHKVPIDKAVEVLEVGRSSVPVINVIGVLPNIHSQERLITVGKRVTSIGGIDDSDISVRFSKPSPS